MSTPLLATGARIAVVGAGVSGVAAARALLAEGYDVTVFERVGDIGGVWSASRAYPGISTQDDRVTYSFSDSAIEPGPDAHPTGEEVRRYLERVAERGGVLPRIRFGTRVVRASRSGDGWCLETDGPDGRSTGEYDWLVAANGTFSTPFVPHWPGREAFEEAGGVVVEPGALGDGALLDGRDVLVVGWGKTGCDIATEAAPRAASTAVVARTMTWKYPRRLGIGRLTYRHLILTRGGQWLVWASYRGEDGRLLKRRLLTRLPRQVAGWMLGRAMDRASGLGPTGLRPEVGVHHSHSLTTPGFFEAVAAGTIRVHRDRSVVRLGADAEGTFAVLTDGSRVPAGVVVAATGYDQALDFLDPSLVAGAPGVRLYRRCLALDVPRFAVAGWSHSYHSPLAGEITAAWLAAVLTGRAGLPSAEEQQRRADAYPVVRRDPAAASTVRVPGVMLDDLDAMLAELGRPLPWRTRVRQWWRPLDPADYAAALRLPAAPREPARS